MDAVERLREAAIWAHKHTEYKLVVVEPVVLHAALDVIEAADSYVNSRGHTWVQDAADLLRLSDALASFRKATEYS